ncbi:glycoside hydrolase family 5 protein [Xylaria sp. CBS 124048]|nr:glycoside hydrolase family 5 protein [Xylaria sp. CBS 124048]
MAPAQPNQLPSWLAIVSFLFLSLSVSAHVVTPRASWPNGPLVTSGRWITDASGTKVTYAGVNWPGAMDTMIPEGLQYQSIETIVSKIKSLGMNAIRLTYAIEMIDQYYDNGERDVSIQQAFTNALGQDDGMSIYNQVVAKNPSFGPETTRLQVFDAIAAECAKQQIYVHLDNHVSKAIWCCNPFDGNSWFGDTYFHVGNWTRGLSFMAKHGKAWPSLMSMSLRNELRIPLDEASIIGSYNWENWYTFMQQGAEVIHTANPDVLIFLSGLDSDKDLTAVVQGTPLEPGALTFNRGDFDPYGNKLVLELHVYDNILGTPSKNCSMTTSRLFDKGFETLSGKAANNFPLVVTEFGFPQSASTSQFPYASCLMKYFPSQRVGWMIWEISGSHYIRSGTKDSDEKWGLLTHDWSSWRSPGFINELLIPAVTASTSPINSDDFPDDGNNGTNGSQDDTNSGSTLSRTQDNLMFLTLGVIGLVAIKSYA